MAEHPFSADGGAETRMTLSIGIAVYPRDGQSREELVDKADRAMFAAKKLGRNSIFGAERLSEVEAAAS